MKINTRALYIFCSVILAGCAQTYVPPTSSHTATLILPAKKSNYQLMGALYTNYFQFAVGKKEDNNCGFFYEPVESDKNLEYVEVKIAAGKEIFIRATFTEGNRECHTSSYFISEEGKRYFVTAADYNIFCQLKVREKLKGTTEIPVPLKEAFSGRIIGSKVCSNEENL